MKTKMIGIALFAAACFCLICSCANNGGDSVQSAEPSPAPKTDPVTLNLYHFSLTLTDEDYGAYFEEPLKKKFPYVTLNRIKNDTGTKNPAELMAAGVKPDIVFAGIDGMGDMKAVKLAADLTPQLKTHQIDLNKYEPAAIDLVRDYGDHGEIYGIPLYLNFGALYYNKDVFDKFGVPYPKDGMLWDDAVELGRKLTRQSDGVQYRGLDTGTVTLLGSQLSLPFVDPKTYAATINNDNWQKIMTLLKKVADIPGNLPAANQYTNTNDFFQKRNVAMFSYYLNGGLSTLEDLLKKGQPLNWDVVSLPSFPGAPSFAYQIDFHNISLSSLSQHPDQAMDVITYLVSEEHQQIISKGRISSMPIPALRKNYGAGFATAAGKNLTGALSTKPAKRPKPSFDIEIDKAAKKEITTAATEITTKGVDINTALRNAEQRANTAIQQILNK